MADARRESYVQPVCCSLPSFTLFITKSALRITAPSSPVPRRDLALRFPESETEASGPRCRKQFLAACRCGVGWQEWRAAAANLRLAASNELDDFAFRAIVRVVFLAPALTCANPLLKEAPETRTLSSAKARLSDQEESWALTQGPFLQNVV